MKKFIHNFSSNGTTLLLVLGIFYSFSAIAQLENSPQVRTTAVGQLHQQMIYKAMDLAKEKFQAPNQNVPDSLKKLTYQDYRNIRFNADKALWKDESLFEAQLFHPGFLYQNLVNLYEIVDNDLINIAFTQDMFRYDGNAYQFRELNNGNLGFSGFRVHYPLNNQQYKDELIVFQGASYFRPLGPGLIYGASARGLAIDTAESSGEEFPFFREFWLVKPTAKSNEMVIYALLDSPSITGAYKFTLQPGLPTSVLVDMDLFPRKDIKKLGLAPLTSMFFYGENSIQKHDDFRPEVHDSDGLLVETHHGEWIWRPLSNPKSLHISSFALDKVKGFGLIQRDRDFYRYQDMEAHYHKRPSIWITPTGKQWGKGRVELVEIPTRDETNDNIVAYWVPEKAIKKGDHITRQYEVNIVDQPAPTILGKVSQTRNGWAAIPGESDPPALTKRLFVIDFKGWPKDMLNSDLKITPKLNRTGGLLSDLTVTPLPDNETWRVSFKINPIGNDAIDMNLHLLLGSQVISETWSYVWYTEEVDK
jgi:glucans biosynthesis protein